jgi:hypothetical protein
VHPEAAQACRRAIQSGLAGVGFEAGKVYPLACVSEYLEQFKRVAHKDSVLKQWLSTPDLFYIAYSSMARAMKERMKLPAAATGLLREQIGEEGLREIEDSVLRVLESIPRQYVGYFSMPHAENLGMASGDIADGIRFIEATSIQDAPAFLRQPVASTGGSTSLSSLLGVASAAQAPRRYYLEIRGQGFSDGSLSNRTGAKAAIRLLR